MGGKGGSQGKEKGRKNEGCEKGRKNVFIFIHSFISSQTPCDPFSLPGVIVGMGHSAQARQVRGPHGAHIIEGEDSKQRKSNPRGPREQRSKEVTECVQRSVCCHFRWRPGKGPTGKVTVEDEGGMVPWARENGTSNSSITAWHV